MKKFLDVFLGSVSKPNPLIRFAWISEDYEPDEKSEIVAIRGEPSEQGTLKLYFDSAIKTEIDAIFNAVKNRGKRINQERPFKFGFGAQTAYWHYLNFFQKRSKFRFSYDDPFGSYYNRPYDFRIFFPKLAFWLEIKSQIPNMSMCRYFISPYYRYPEYVVCVRVLNEEMTNYEIYGFCTGEDVQKIPHGAYHEIPVDREHFRLYSEFHTKILKLPMIEKFDNEHYV